LEMLARTIQTNTPLVSRGVLNVTIIYPACDPAFEQLAHKLAGALQPFAGTAANLVADRAVIPTIHDRLPALYRQQPLILLGNLNTNRALLPLYARYYCFTDAIYPGGDGYDLRTLVNPYGQGANVILAGGSSLAGVEKAVDRLIDQIQAAALSGGLVLPFLLEIELDPDLRQKLYAWPDAPLAISLPNDAVEWLKGVGAYAMMYAATGDRRFGELGGKYLRLVNAQMTDSYGDRHYYMERLMRAIPWLAAGGFLDAADILRTDNLLLGMALGSQAAWWRMSSAQPPLGHRHHGKGTYEFYLIARFLREQAAPEPEVAALCDRWIQECQTFLDALGRALLDDQDDETTLNNLSTVFWYSLSEERFDFFESGSARAWAQRVIALHDNTGAAAGPGGYGESLLSMTYVQQEATTPIAACAFYYQDGQFKWVLHNLPRLNPPLRGGFWSFCPIFIHKFDTGPELAPQAPGGLTGLKLLPATPYQMALNNNPPQHIEYAGHMVNAPETWMSPEGVGANRLPRDMGFDKLVLRGGYQRDDPYLVIQGYQGGFRWQGHMKAANCILRFSQAGHIFLMQNTRAHSQYYKNGVLVSDGFNSDPMPPIAEWLAVDDFSQAGLSVTRLNAYHHTAWSRHLFWSKGADDYFVVVDCIVPEVDGDYAAVCTWRTLGYAALEGRTWRADQGDHKFILRTGAALAMLCEEERDLGAANPFVLHQLMGGHYHQGEIASFQNLFYVRPTADGHNIDIRRLGPKQALLLRDGIPFSWIGTDPGRAHLQALGLGLEATSAWVTSEFVRLAGAISLAMPGSQAWNLSSDSPVGIELDLKRARLAVRLDGPDTRQATLTLSYGGNSQVVHVDAQSPVEIDLPASLCQLWAAAIQRALADLKALDSPDLLAPEPTVDHLKLDWKFDGATRIQERLREMTVAATPLPLDGIPEQLIDTVPMEIRETWQNWPKAPQYNFTLTFPHERAIDSLNLIGDSLDEPFLKSFQPLPADIQVMASSDGFTADRRLCQVAAAPTETNFKRYRGQLDRMESRRVVVGQKARRLRVTIPAPVANVPLVFQEIEVYGTGLVPPGIAHLLSADLEGRGRRQVLAVTSAHELIVLDDQGHERWRHQFAAAVNHISCHDLHGDGQQSICAGLLGGDLVILSPDGAVRKHLQLGPEFSARQDVFFGWLHTIYSIAVWQRDTNGRAALALGCYSVVVFLDVDGRIIGHSWADAPWLVNILPVPAGQPGEGDLYVRCGWNHGIGYYAGQVGTEPSGESLVFGGVRQPMFRALRKIIPFVNGRTAAFEWFTGNTDLGRVIVAAADDGVGVFSTTSRNFLWKVEGGTTITACLPIPTQDGQGQVMVGGVDGFVASFALPDGTPLRRWWAGAPVVGLAHLAQASTWLAATRQGVWALDPDWNVKAFFPVKAVALCQTSDLQVTVACQDGSLVSLQNAG
jgi:hypothetical protein